MGNVKKNKWFIAIKERGEDLFDLSGLRIIEPEKDTYHADPFLFRGKIFFELYDYNKGVIACMDTDGKNIQTVLERPYHLSFPFIIEDEGEIYMIPESGMAGAIELYRCVEFPDKWEHVKTLVQGVFGDTVVHKDSNGFKMFTTEGDNNLRIFVSDKITGPWQKLYAESHMHSRSAGRIFERTIDGMNGSELVRPTQDGETYGKQIYFKAIEFPYKEKLIGIITPNWTEGLSGTHTFNFDDNFIVIDGRKPL